MFKKYRIKKNISRRNYYNFKVNDIEKFRSTGEVNFVKPSSLPSDFKPYDSFDEATVLGWVKTTIGTDGVTAIEKVIDDNIAIINTPVTATGKPF